MLKTNYHCHSHYCDGKETPAAYIEAAIKQRFSVFGFSSHAPLPYSSDWNMSAEQLPRYLEEINSLKKKYSAVIEIVGGLELDYLPGRPAEKQATIANTNLDYAIGSLHLMPAADSEQGFSEIDGDNDKFVSYLNNYYSNNPKNLACDYYHYCAQMIRLADTMKFQIVGHYDLIKKQNSIRQLYFDNNDPDYRKSALAPLSLIKEKGLFVELNYGGIARGRSDEYFPADFILKRCRQLAVPIVISGDYHTPQLVGTGHQAAVDHLRYLGFDRHWYLSRGEWRYEKIYS